MKHILLFALIACLFASCAATKRDCRGVKHYRQSGGFYLFVKPVTICPDCGESDCILHEIDELSGDKTDSSFENAIQLVCTRRGITDPKTIDLLRANYYL